MASFLVWAGRFLFFGLALTQCFLLASYPSKKSGLWYLTSLSYAPSLLAWTSLVVTDNTKLGKLSYIWALYAIGLVVSTIIVFAAFVDTIDKGSLLGLKVTLCITPILLLLLLNTAKDVKKHKDLLPWLCFAMAVDLVDTIEMIDIVLDEVEKEHEYRIPKGFAYTMVAIACINFLLSPWQMLENDFETGELLPKRALWRYIVEIVVVNFVFLITRLVILIEYEKDESIFILKNLVAIILGIMGIRKLKTDIKISDLCCKDFGSNSLHL
ncbi:uncharacterized protein [Acropora muricata]|uniref:uncharacterized protein n=1 Tax=Acropora muricata TaxID=159855 RepID=UPI0034E4E924